MWKVVFCSLSPKLTSQVINAGLSVFFSGFFKAQEDLTKTPFYTIFLGSRYHPKKKGVTSLKMWRCPSFERTALKMKKTPATSLAPASKAKTVPMPGSQKPEFEALFSFQKKQRWPQFKTRKRFSAMVLKGICCWRISVRLVCKFHITWGMNFYHKKISTDPEKLPQVLRTPKYERISFINSWLRVRGMFQG